MSRMMNFARAFYREVREFIKKRRRSKGKWIILCITAVVCLISLRSLAAFPQQINYQGKLTNASNVPLTGSYSMLFTIYDASTSGTDLWNETQTVSVESGFFNVLLGSGTAISTEVFTGADRWLGIKVASDAEMTPRQKLVSVGHAYKAYNSDNLGGQPASYYGVSSNNILKAGDTMGNTTTTTNESRFRYNVGASTPQNNAVINLGGEFDGGLVGLGNPDSFSAQVFGQAKNDGTATAGSRQYTGLVGFADTTRNSLEQIGLAGLCSGEGSIAAGLIGGSSAAPASNLLFAIGYTSQPALYVNQLAHQNIAQFHGPHPTYLTIDDNAVLHSDVTGTAPFVIASSATVENLNADLLDDKHASDFAIGADYVLKAGDTMTGPLSMEGAWISAQDAVGDDVTGGITWATNDPTNYGIYRTPGVWEAKYQQLKLKWATGLILDGGSAYGASGTVIQPGDGNVSVGTTEFTSKLAVAGTIEIVPNSGGGVKFNDGTTQTTAAVPGNYVLKAGDTMTGSLTAESITAAGYTATSSGAFRSVGSNETTASILSLPTNAGTAITYNLNVANLSQDNPAYDSWLEFWSGDPINASFINWLFTPAGTTPPGTSLMMLGSAGQLYTAGTYSQKDGGYNGILDFTSSPTLDASRTLTVDLANGSRTLKLTGDLTGNQDVSTTGTPQFASLKINTSESTSTLTVAGTIEITAGGIKFPDGTIQTTEATGSGGGNYVSKTGDTMTGNLTIEGNLYVSGTIESGSPVKIAGGLSISGQYNSIKYTASAAIDWANGNVQDLTLGGSNSLTFSNLMAGAIYTLYIRQDGTGGRTITWPSSGAVVKWPGGVAPTLSSSISALDVFTFTSDGTNLYNLGFAADLK